MEVENGWTISMVMRNCDLIVFKPDEESKEIDEESCRTKVVFVIV